MNKKTKQKEMKFVTRLIRFSDGFQDTNHFNNSDTIFDGIKKRMKKYSILFLFYECGLLLINFQRFDAFAKTYFDYIHSRFERTEIYRQKTFVL